MKEQGEVMFWACAQPWRNIGELGVGGIRGGNWGGPLFSKGGWGWGV